MLEPGTLIQDKYRVERLLGVGGMGAVYEAENVRIRRRVAIKVLKPEVSADDESVSRFEREAQAAGQIGSDHILQVLDVGLLPDGARYMVMEYLDGEALGARIARLGRMSPADLLPILRQVLEALDATHAAGIVHRDLKPDNVYIVREKAGQSDYVKLIDFGISKFQSHGAGALSMTKTGAVMGTPLYMSPEQAKGSRDIDARADLYAVGLIAYEAISGRLPFEVETFHELIMKIAFDDPPHPRTFVPDVDEAFCSIVLKCMARDRDQRFATARELIATLDEWAAHGTSVAVPTAVTTQTTTAPLEPLPVEATAAPPEAPVAHAATGASWSASQRIEARPSRFKAPLVLALGGGIAVLGGAAVLLAVLLGRGNADAETNAALSATPVTDPPASAASVASAAPAAPSVDEPELPAEPAPSASAKKKLRVKAVPSAKPAASVKPAGRDFGY